MTPAALARGLSPAQERALRSSDDPRSRVFGLDIRTAKTARAMHTLGFIEWCAPITPLGLAVRAELVRREAGDGG